MNVPRPLIGSGLMLAIVLTVVSVGFFVQKQEKEKTRKQHQEIARLENEFEQDVQRAKRATANPCTTVFYEFIKPPVGLGGESKLIMFGEEVSSNIDSSAYQLRLNGDKIELWSLDVLETKNSGTIKFRKIGEKYNPYSKFCRERKIHVGTEF